MRVLEAFLGNPYGTPKVYSTDDSLDELPLFAVYFSNHI